MKSIKEIRRTKLATAIAERCEGSQTRAADALGYSTPSLVNRYLSGGKDIGDKAARKIEATFGYPKFWMDSEAQWPAAAANHPSTAVECQEEETAQLAVNAWPFSSVTPQRWASLPEGVRIRAESLAEGAIREWEANNPEAPVKPAHAKSDAA